MVVASVVSSVISSVISSVGGTLPDQVERVTFASTLRIFDTDHRDAAVLAGIAQQLHAAASVDALKTKVRRPLRHDARALEAAPLGRLSRESSYAALIAADLDFRNVVDVNFNRALTAVWIAAAAHGCAHGGDLLCGNRHRGSYAGECE
jgi:hypothetical protein